MAKDKNVDYNKLSLGVKLPVKRVEEAAAPTVVEQAVSNIHAPSVATATVAIAAAEAPPIDQKERTLRVTLDIPQSLHAEIRTYTFRKGVSMKDYFLELAKRDIGL